MKSRAVVLGVLVTIVILLIWNFLIFSPKGKTLSNAKKDTEAAQAVGSTLRATLTRLQDINHNGPAIAAELDKLSAAVPASPDLDGFILSANQIAVKSGIDWLSVSPSVAQAGTSGPSVIPLSIQIKGGFFQVLDYLNRLEAMGRLVVVQGISISAAGESSTASGPPVLTVSLTASMYTRAAPPPAAGTAPTPGTASSTSGSTPPASGSSSGSGETSTTAQVN
jgi:Tfp pilus assembly protein PilO